MSNRNSKELDILSNLFNKLSDEEKEELLELVDKKSKTQSKKAQPVNRFDEIDLSDENPKHREVSKKLNKSIQKHATRREVKFVKVKCKNCGKEYEVAENYPNIDKFICCV